MKMTLADWNMIVEILKEAHKTEKGKENAKWEHYKSLRDAYKKEHPNTTDEEVERGFKKQYDDYCTQANRVELIGDIINTLENAEI